MTGHEDIPAEWAAWSRGEGRCPYCADDDDLFHSNCDCWYHDRVCEVPGCLGK